jgi:LPS sulfotransferase NodH
VLNTGATPNGIFVLKFHPFLLQSIKGIDLLAALPDVKLINLQRRDRLGQAISWARVRQTGQHRETDSSRGQAHYDPALIRESLEFIEEQYGFWRDFFVTKAAASLDIVYEDLCNQPMDTIATIAKLFGVNGAKIDPLLVSTIVQRDEQTEKWRARFSSEHGGVTWGGYPSAV